MHPQHELPIEPYSRLLSAAADRITRIRDRVSTTGGDIRDHRSRLAQAGIAAGALLAAAAVATVLVLLGDALGSGVSWLATLAADSAVVVWDRMLYPGSVAAVTDWFAAHAGALGFDPMLVLLCWVTVGGVLWIASSTAHRRGLVGLGLWLGWAAATTILAHAGAAPSAAALAAGTTAAALALATVVGLLQLPDIPPRVRGDEDALLRTRMERQQTLLAAAREADAPAAELDRLRAQLADTVSRLTPGAQPALEWRLALYHQSEREFQALRILGACAATVASWLLLGATGWGGWALVAVLVTGATAVVTSTADYDEWHAQQILRRRDLALVD